MPSSSPTKQVDRARPLLGTLVAIRASGLPETEANRVIDAAFAEVADIHRLMSFHEPDSDLTRLNRMALAQPVVVDERTYQVMGQALEFARVSAGIFDPTVAGRLVAWGFLPSAHLSRKPNQRASWRDIELLTSNKIRFHRPLWVDFGGIAKGYAVDRAIECMAKLSLGQYLVNAGGDLRVSGSASERVFLRLGTPPKDGMIPAIEISNGSVASSSGREHVRTVRGKKVGPHVHGQEHGPVGLRSFVSVVSERCVIADALTKIVLANGPRSAAILRKYEATAYLHNARHGWRTLGAGHDEDQVSSPNTTG